MFVRRDRETRCGRENKIRTGFNAFGADRTSINKANGKEQDGEDDEDGAQESKQEAWLEKANLAAQKDPNKLFRCTADGCNESYTRLAGLIKHLNDIQKGIPTQVDQTKTLRDTHYDILDNQGWIFSTPSESCANDDEPDLDNVHQEPRASNSKDLPRLQELTEAQPAVVGGRLHPYGLVGPFEQDLSMLEYPDDVKGGPMDPRQLYREAEAKGILASNDQPSLVDIMEQRGLSDLLRGPGGDD